MTAKTKFYVFCIVGSTRAGDLNASCHEFDTLAEAVEQKRFAMSTDSGAHVWIVEGIERD